MRKKGKIYIYKGAQVQPATVASKLCTVCVRCVYGVRTVCVWCVYCVYAVCKVRVWCVHAVCTAYMRVCHVCKLGIQRVQ